MNMETAIMWGWLLTASLGSMPPIIDPNYKTQIECETVKADFALKYPAYDVACTPTWRPDKPLRAKRRVTHRGTVSAATRQRSVSQRVSRR